MKIITNNVNINNSKAQLISYVDNNLDGSNQIPIIIVPGGSYTNIDLKQNQKVALKFLSLGYQVSILRYSLVGEIKPFLPEPLKDLAHSVNIIKINANNWKIDANKLILMGFSIGGHVVSNFNNYWNSTWLKQQTNISNSLLKPFGTILGFPVISPYLGFPDKKTLKTWSDNPGFSASDKYVNTDNVPTFIWGTSDDSAVPVQNALSYYESLIDKNIPAELHLFEHGPHGLLLATAQTAYDQKHIDKRIAQWVSLADSWIQKL